MKKSKYRLIYQEKGILKRLHEAHGEHVENYGKYPKHIFLPRKEYYEYKSQPGLNPYWIKLYYRGAEVHMLEE